MSAAAEKRVRAITDPRVTEVGRDLLDAIAKLIPEGETTTPLIGMGNLARRAHMHRRTVWTWVPVLVEIGEVCIVDGGQGRPARYALVHLDGARPPTAAPLPLVGETPRRAPSRPLDRTLDLFDPPLVRSDSEELVIRADHKDHKLAARTITRITSWWRSSQELLNIAITRITRITSSPPIVRSDSEELVIGTCDPCDPAADVRTTTTTTRTTTAREAPTADAAPVHPWHAWCAGRVHVPKNQHAEFLRRLGRQPGETDAALEARAFACYAAELATIPDDQPIAVPNEFLFWRPRFARMLAAAAPARAPTPTIHQEAGDDVWVDVLRVIDARVPGREFKEWFVPTVLVEDRGAVIVIAGPAGATGDFIVDWIEKHYGDVVHQAVEAVRPGARIEFRRQVQRTG